MKKIIEFIRTICGWPWCKKHGFYPYAIYGCYLPLDSNEGLFDITFINTNYDPNPEAKNYIVDYETVSETWGYFRIEPISIVKYLKLYWKYY